MTTLLLAAGGKWDEPLRKRLPDVTVIRRDAITDLAEIDYALVWMPEPGFLASLPNLKVIFSAAAGVDHILRDPDWPKHLPIVRMSDPYQCRMMAEYAIYGVLHFHRFFDVSAANQRTRTWEEQPVTYTPDMTVGVLGLGAIGVEIAARLSALDFQVRGWSRSKKHIDGLICHHGADGLRDMLPACNFIVCALPLTPETRGLIDAEFLSLMPSGGVIINVGRGGHVVDADLIAALDTGHIKGAVLDVFDPEPLPAGHTYWTRPNVVVTPHMAGELLPRTAARSVAEGIRRHMAGDPLEHVYDPERGY